MSNVSTIGTIFDHEATAVRQSIKWLTDKYLLHLERLFEANHASAEMLRLRKSLMMRPCQNQTD